MSLPSFPVSGPPIEREDAVNQILSSIAMEEPGLGHILNAEGEKLQYILGTLPGLSGPPATVGDVLAANDSVRGMLETAAQNQLFLKTKMQKALTASPMQGPAGPAGAAGPGLTSAFAANTQGSSIPVSPNGTLVALPNAQALSPGFTANSWNSVFTVPESGVYQISYHVNTTTVLPLKIQLVINGAGSALSTIDPVVPTTSYENKIKIILPANSKISLRIFSKIAGAAVLTGGGAGASLSIIRLDEAIGAGEIPPDPGEHDSDVEIGDE